MSTLEELRKRLETEEAFENSAEIGLNLLAALEAVEAVAKSWCAAYQDSASDYNDALDDAANEIEQAIKEALQ